MNLNQITVPSRDLEKSVEFYQKLGLRLIVDSVLKSKINSRVAYTEVSVLGQGVFEYSDPKAKSEMVSLTKEILEKAKELKLME